MMLSCMLAGMLLLSGLATEAKPLSANPLPGKQLSAKEITDWQVDIDVYARTFPARHIDAFDQISEATFNRRLQALKASLASKSRVEVIIELMRLTRAVGDGHTGVPLWQQDMDSFSLPHSNLLITYSKRHFKLENHQQPVTPDIVVPQRWQDWRQASDATLKAVTDRLKQFMQE